MGAWELVGEDVPSGTVFTWAREKAIFLEFADLLLTANENSKVIRGTTVGGGDIPVNRGPTIAGIVEISRAVGGGVPFAPTDAHSPSQTLG